MPKRFLRYFLVFCAGLAIASILPVVASPVRETAARTQNNQETLLAQNSSEAALSALAGCLDWSGYKHIKPVPNSSPSPIPGAVDGRIANANNSCTRLRFEGQIQQEIRCLDNGEIVQVQLKDGQPIVRQWNDGESTKDFIFVISYRDGSKGWVWNEAVAYRLPFRL
ncbi:hypothetical protein [Leptolyngbya ohadii]|uniref:hypothetical protein n=1 Tax=Leptolyngbya ohadii TaxID=1962290 RepID=UPI000B5996BF|nr:hypothetical protein [Leptolyngbya ohadii]